jgi:hypothetical protein
MHFPRLCSNSAANAPHPCPKALAQSRARAEGGVRGIESGG